jgi:hypothetical protein
MLLSTRTFIRVFVLHGDTIFYLLHCVCLYVCVNVCMNIGVYVRIYECSIYVYIRGFV